MIYSRAFVPFITHFLKIMIRHSHVLAAKHLRSRYWWCMVGHLNLFLPTFGKCGRTFTPSCSRTPPLSLSMMYSRAFTPFFTRFSAIMVRHSHLLAAEHLRSHFWWCIVGHSHFFLPVGHSPVYVPLNILLHWKICYVVNKFRLFSVFTTGSFYGVFYFENPSDSPCFVCVWLPPAWFEMLTGSPEIRWRQPCGTPVSEIKINLLKKWLAIINVWTG